MVIIKFEIKYHLGLQQYSYSTPIPQLHLHLLLHNPSAIYNQKVNKLTMSLNSNQRAMKKCTFVIVLKREEQRDLRRGLSLGGFAWMIKYKSCFMFDALLLNSFPASFHHFFSIITSFISFIFSAFSLNPSYQKYMKISHL